MDDDLPQDDTDEEEPEVEEDDGEVIFLTAEQVIILHDEGIRQFSPGEPLEVRDHGLLDSAIHAPQHSFGGEYLYSTLAEMAAAYLISLCQNHAFEQGNKRVGFAACSIFLRMNGYQLTLSQEEAIDLTLRVANHAIERDEVVAFLEGAIEPLL